MSICETGAINNACLYTTVTVFCISKDNVCGDHGKLGLGGLSGLLRSNIKKGFGGFTSCNRSMVTIGIVGVIGDTITSAGGFVVLLFITDQLQFDK